MSPIFPVLPNESEIPDLSKHFYIGFFTFRGAFAAIGELLAVLPTDQQTKMWFSHGLASLIVFASDEGVFEQIRTEQRERLRAWETWTVRKNVLTHVDTWLCDPEKVDPSEFHVGDPVGLPADVRGILVECRSCLATAVSRAAQYLPSQLLTYRSLAEAINEIVEELVFLADMDGVPPKSVPENAVDSLRADPVERLRRTHQVTGELVQINSALSYVISQAYSGATPILRHDCHVRTYSLLGIGSAFCALAGFSRFIECVFESHPVDEAIEHNYRLMGQVEVVRSLQSFDPSMWELPEDRTLDESLKSQTPSQSNPKLVFFSGRLGFRETQFSVTASIQVLAAADLARWTLMTVTHELLHAHVRAVLAVLFADAKRRSPSQAFADYYRRYMEYMREASESPPSLLECLRFIIFNYLRSRMNCRASTQATNSAGVSAGNQTTVRTNTVLPTEGSLWEEFASDFRDLNEIMVHVLDYQYFYNGDSGLYLRFLWQAWATVPAVLENVEHYLLRSVVAVSVDETGTFTERFDLARQIVREVLEDLAESHPGNPLAREALNVVRDRGSGQRLKTAFLPGLYLAEMVMKFIRSTTVNSQLYKADKNIDTDGDTYTYLLDAGEFPGVVVGSPVAFILDRLRRALCGETSDLPDEHLAAWVLLACASSLDGS